MQAVLEFAFPQDQEVLLVRVKKIFPEKQLLFRGEKCHFSVRVHLFLWEEYLFAVKQLFLMVDSPAFFEQAYQHAELMFRYHIFGRSE